MRVKGLSLPQAERKKLRPYAGGRRVGGDRPGNLPPTRIGSSATPRLGRRRRDRRLPDGKPPPGRHRPALPQNCPGARSRISQIILDTTTGERVVLWEKDPRLALNPATRSHPRLCRARAIHLDATDLPASRRVARLARKAAIPVVAGPGRRLPRNREPCCRSSTISSRPPISSHRPPASAIPFRALERLAGATQGRLAWA